MFLYGYTEQLLKRDGLKHSFTSFLVLSDSKHFFFFLFHQCLLSKCCTLNKQQHIQHNMDVIGATSVHYVKAKE